jgi:DNA replication and repair protein RecF
VRLGRFVARDFRNLERVELKFPERGVVLVGGNGQGKTNLLEALHYLELFRSVRGARDRELVGWGATAFHLEAELEGVRIGVGYDARAKLKRVTVDGAPAGKLSDAIGHALAVMFSPADVALVAGPPSERRRYLDVVLSLAVPGYLQTLLHYRAALAQRNAALRRGRGDEAAVFEPALAASGAPVVRERAAWIAGRAARYAELVKAAGEPGDTVIRYVPRGDGLEASDRFRAALSEGRERDLTQGSTLTGPHRDELRLMLGEHDIRTFGSAGQQRTAAIALRLLEAESIAAARGTDPVVLLDDVFAELDGERRERVAALLDARGAGRGQVVLAVPRDADLPASAAGLPRWQIRCGKVVAHH